MTKLSKKDLQLVGSAGNMDSLKSLIKSKLYWAEVNTTESSMYESRLGKVYEVGNRNGRFEGRMGTFEARFKPFFQGIK